MKNKVIISLLSLCALLASASCEKSRTDTLLPGANLSIRLKVDGPALTKTSGSTVDDEASESAISSLTLCFVSTTDLNSDSDVIILPQTTDDGQPALAWEEVEGQSYNYEVNAIVPESISGSYYLYVIANKPSWMSISKYSDLCGKVWQQTSESDLDDCWEEDNFLMVNVQNDVTDDTMDQAGVAVTLDPESGIKVSDVNVTIERLATKILVNKNLDMDVAPLLTPVLYSNKTEGQPDIKGAIAAMEIVGYRPLNCVNSFYLIQRWNDQTPATEAAHLLVSPSSFPAYGTDAGHHLDNSGYYNLYEWNPDDPDPLWEFEELGTPFYCMENNSPYFVDIVGEEGATAACASPGTKMKGRVTGIVFKVKVGIARGFSGSAVIGENLDIETPDIDWDNDGSSPTTEAFAKGQKTKAGEGEDNSASDITYATFYQYKGNYYGDTACLKSNNSELASCSTDAALRGKGVKIYEGGYMYYNYWIEDRNYTDNGKHYLSIMRNTFYDIKVTAINSLGDEYPCGGGSYNPEAPISIDIPKLSISMDIPDWAEVTDDYTISDDFAVSNE